MPRKENAAHRSYNRVTVLLAPCINTTIGSLRLPFFTCFVAACNCEQAFATRIAYPFSSVRRLSACCRKYRKQSLLESRSLVYCQSCGSTCFPMYKTNQTAVPLPAKYCTHPLPLNYSNRVLRPTKPLSCVSHAFWQTGGRNSPSPCGVHFAVCRRAST